MLVDLFDWFSVFLLNVPLGLIAFAFGWMGINGSADPDHAAIDPVGLLLSVLLLESLTFALTEAGRRGWDTPLALADFHADSV